MAALALNLLPAFLNGGGGGLSGILGNVTGSFGGLISGIGNTISGIGGNTNMGYTQPAAPKSNKKMYYVIGGLSIVIVLGTVLIVAKKK
jgi:hypothetical protein